MSEHDRALLLAFCADWWCLDHRSARRPEPEEISKWLAARAQPEAYSPYPRCPRGSPPGECVECDGGSGTIKEAAPKFEQGSAPGPHVQADLNTPAPPAERFWKVHRAHGTTGHIAWECDKSGMVLSRITPICGAYSMGREKLSDAEEDGRKSGLKPWKGGK